MTQSELIADLRAKLREATKLARMRHASNRIYARENRKLWRAHIRMSSTLERIENRRRARREARKAALPTRSPSLENA